MKLRGVMLALGAVFAMGCYTYVPVEVGTIAPGESVRARLSSEAVDQLPPTVQGEGRFLEGELLDRDSDGFTLFVSSAVRQQGFYAQSLRERVRLTESDVIELERRQLNRSQTYVLVGAGAAAVTAIAIQTLSGKTGGNTIDPTVPGPSASRILLFSVGVR